MSNIVSLSPSPILQFFNNLGQMNAGGSVLTQIGGVNAATYQDPNGNTPLPNPIPLNNRGEVSNASGVSCQLFLIAGETYTFTLYDVNGNQLNQALYVDALSIEDITAANLVGGIQVVNSISALQALSKLNISTTAEVLGFYAEGDGGGGKLCRREAGTGRWS